MFNNFIFTIIPKSITLRCRKEFAEEEIISNMNELIGESTNFFYRKTIYKVKKGDK